jgi:hypothetical protein
MISNKASARIIGALFLAGFPGYIIGFRMVTSVVSAPDFILTIPAHQTALIIGALLML